MKKVVKFIKNNTDYITAILILFLALTFISIVLSIIVDEASECINRNGQPVYNADGKYIMCRR